MRWIVALLTATLLAVSSPLQAQTDGPAAPPADEAPQTAPADEPADDEAGEDEPATEEEPADEPSAEPTAEKPPADSANPGQAALDEATQLRLTAESGRDLSKVIDLLGKALEDGLDADNKTFAEQMLVSSLLERAQALSQAILDRQLPDPRQDPRWLQIRQVALSDIERLLAIDASQVEAHFMLGRLHSLPLGDRDTAREAFTKVIQSEGVEPAMLAEAHVRRAAETDDVAAQLADLDKAVELASDKIEYRLMRARHYFATEEFDKCLADIDQVLEKVNDNYATHELKALVLLAQGKTEDALASFDKATELAPDAVGPYQKRSELFARLGNLDKALEQVNKAVELEPENPLSYLLRASLKLDNDQPDEALKDIDKADELREGMVQTFLLRARAYGQLERVGEAIDELEKLAEAIPPQAEIYLQIAAYALQDEQPRRAIAALDRAVEIDDKNTMAYRLRGDAKLNISDHVGAMADYEKVLELEPDDSGALNNLAWTMATSPKDELRNGKRAIELATKACELTDFKAAHILSTLAAAHAEAGDFEKAKEWSRKAVELDDEENGPQIAEELASYEAGKPWRESQQLDSGEKPKDETEVPRDEPKPTESTPAPARTIDF